MKWVVYIIFAVAFLLITYFGLGPVLFADGTMTERLITLAIVGILYFILIVLFIFYIE